MEPDKQDKQENQDKQKDDKLKDEYAAGTSVLATQLVAHLSAFDVATDTFFINLATLLRNRLTPNKSDVGKESAEYKRIITRSAKDMVNSVSGELKVLIKSMIQAVNNTKVEKPYILLYCPSYETILPTDIIRPIDGQRQIVHEACNLMIKEIKNSGLNKDKKIDKLTVRYMPITSKCSISKYLLTVLRTIKNNRQLLMVSHQPLDWHICDVAKNMLLLESHTGNYKHPDQFGMKAFGIDLPFVPAIHAALGDKSLIKPCLTAKNKAEFMKTAETQNWSIRTTDYISAAIRHKGWVSKEVESYFSTR